MQSPLDLGTILAGSSSSKYFPEAITLTINEAGWVTCNFELVGDLTQLNQDFQSLTINIGRAVTLTLTSPTGTFDIEGPQTISYPVEVVYTVNPEAENPAGELYLTLWFT